MIPGLVVGRGYFQVDFLSLLLLTFLRFKSLIKHRRVQCDTGFRFVPPEPDSFIEEIAAKGPAIICHPGKDHNVIKMILLNLDPAFTPRPN